MRMDFDAALSHFRDGSIDLLHIDGCHTYEAVRHDFEAWLPKLGSGGVVILHDTAEHREGFGVAKFWGEIRGRYRSFNFEHCHGLGLLLVGDQPAPGLRQFMVHAAEEPRRIKQFFEFQGRRIANLQMSFYMLRYAWQAQTMLNTWCSTHGKAVNSKCGSLQEAGSEPAGFVHNLMLHVKEVFGS